MEREDEGWKWRGGKEGLIDRRGHVLNGSKYVEKAEKICLF